MKCTNQILSLFTLLIMLTGCGGGPTDFPQYQPPEDTKPILAFELSEAHFFGGNINDLSIVADGRIVVATSIGLYQNAGVNWTKIRTAPVFTMRKDEAGNLLVPSTNGIVNFESGVDGFSVIAGGLGAELASEYDYDPATNKHYFTRSGEQHALTEILQYDPTTKTHEVIHQVNQVNAIKELTLWQGTLLYLHGGCLITLDLTTLTHQTRCVELVLDEIHKIDGQAVIANTTVSTLNNSIYYKLDLNGDNAWQEFSIGQNNNRIKDIYANNNKYYALTANGIYVSANLQDWSDFESLPHDFYLPTQLAVNGEQVILGTSGGVLEKQGNVWRSIGVDQAVEQLLSIDTSTALALNNSNFMTLVDFEHNNGASEHVAIGGIKQVVSVDDGTLYALIYESASGGMIVKSTDKGKFWQIADRFDFVDGVDAMALEKNIQGNLWVVKTSNEQNSLVEFDLQRGQLTEQININVRGPIKQAKVGPNGWFYALIGEATTPGEFDPPGIHRVKFENGGQTVGLLAWDNDNAIRHIDFNEYNHLSYSHVAISTPTYEGRSYISVDTPAGGGSYASGLINPEIPHKFIDATHILYAQGNAVGVIDMEADEASWVQEFGSPVTAFSVVPGSKAIAITTRDKGFIGRYFFY